MAVAIVSIVPVGTADASISRYVAGCLDVLERSGLRYELNSMGTVIEGPPEEILKAVLDMQRSVFGGGIERVLMHLSLDDRRDKPLTIEGKIESVRRKREGA